MYLEIYPDIIFILNFFIDYTLLLILQKVNRKVSSLKKRLAASAIGAAFAVLAGVFPWMNEVIRFILLNVFAAILMLTVAFGRMKKWELMKQVAALYLITYFIGGLINSIYYYTDFRETMISLGNSFVISNFSLKFVIIIIICLVPALYLFLFLRNRYRSDKKEIYEIELYLNGESIHTQALMDSGNCLYDPVFKKPVMVMENLLAKELLKEQLYKEFESAKNYMEGREANIGTAVMHEQELRLRFIPYQSIGKARGMMIGLLLDKVLIHTGKEIICNEKVTAAICDNHLSTKDDYHVLLHKELI